MIQNFIKIFPTLRKQIYKVSGKPALRKTADIKNSR